MEDARIVKLYWERNPEAIARSREKYEIYCFSLADRIVTTGRTRGVRQRHLAPRLEQHAAPPAQRAADLLGQDHPTGGL